jgi:hypothetical protein
MGHRQVGPVCQRPREKEKGGGGRGPLRKGINGPVGRLGRKEGEVPFLFFLFSFFKPF